MGALGSDRAPMASPGAAPSAEPWDVGASAMRGAPPAAAGAASWYCGCCGVVLDLPA